MHTFGDVEEFAISYELNEHYGGHWLFGKFCYWIGGKVVGDYELGISLSEVIAELRTFAIDNGNRENIDLFQLSPEELYMRLNSTLYGNGNPEFEELALKECWARFQVCPLLDIFNDWQIYLIDSPPKARIIYSFSKEDVVEINLPAGSFDRVIIDVFNALFDIHEVEMTKTLPVQE